MNDANDDTNQTRIDSLPLLTFEDIITFKPDPKCYVVGEGFMRQGAGTLLQSFTGQGKSVLAQQLALHISAGMDIWGMKVPCARKVLYLAGEGDEITWLRDFKSIHAKFKFNRKLVDRNFKLCHVFGFTDGDFSEAFERKVDQCKPEVVIVDNYQSFVTGELNSSTTFREWIWGVDRVIKAKKIALLLLDHFPKPKDDEKGENPTFGVYKGAGHSTKANWARASAELICPNPTASERRFYLNFSKCAERTGLTRDDGGILRRLYVEWSKNPNEPYWDLCEDQGTGLSDRGAVSTMIDREHEAHKDWNAYKIAKMLGCSTSTVSRRFDKMGWTKKGKK